jgi:hypothetical protein
MKREYICPTMRICTLNRIPQLLSGSLTMPVGESYITEDDEIQ